MQIHKLFCNIAKEKKELSKYLFSSNPHPIISIFLSESYYTSSFQSIFPTILQDCVKYPEMLNSYKIPLFYLLNETNSRMMFLQNINMIFSDLTVDNQKFIISILKEIIWIDIGNMNNGNCHYIDITIYQYLLFFIQLLNEKEKIYCEKIMNEIGEIIIYHIYMSSKNEFPILPLLSILNNIIIQNELVLWNKEILYYLCYLLYINSDELVCTTIMNMFELVIDKISIKNDEEKEFIAENENSYFINCLLPNMINNKYSNIDLLINKIKNIKIEYRKSIINLSEYIPHVLVIKTIEQKIHNNELDKWLEYLKDNNNNQHSNDDMYCFIFNILLLYIVDNNSKKDEIMKNLIEILKLHIKINSSKYIILLYTIIFILNIKNNISDNNYYDLLSLLPFYCNVISCIPLIQKIVIPIYNVYIYIYYIIIE